MLERIARGMTKTAAPTPWSERWSNRQPNPHFKTMGVGAALGAGAGALAGLAGDDGINATEVGLGAILGALGGVGWDKAITPHVEDLVALERGPLAHARQVAEKGPKMFGIRERAASKVKELEHEIYNLGLREYLKKGFEGAAVPVSAGLSYIGGKAVGAHGDDEDE